jgi:4-alpha-glucanotransferase
MRFPRASGVLLHPTSLPGRFGIGDLGPEAYRFIDFLAASGQKLWQVLPLEPTGWDNSPYASMSAFAGNPLLISPEKLVERGYLTKENLSTAPAFPDTRVEFQPASAYKQRVLQSAFAAFTETAEYWRFQEDSREWLEPFARFMALKEANEGKPWTKWDPARQASQNTIRYHKFLQFEFFRQWSQLKQHCQANGIRIMGDLPFYVEHDSADVWNNSDLFDLDPQGNPMKVGGVPPDYFSVTGQLWGNPAYRWDRLAQSGYHWWIERIRWSLTRVDMVRLDHFRGFQAYWEVPAGKPNAIEGRWIAGPGAKLFEAAEAKLGILPLVAEDLGSITPEVEALREQLSFPGMKVLQFAFGDDAAGRIYLPHTYPHNAVAYTGTHDNDTALGWWRSRGEKLTTQSPESMNERERAEIYLGLDGSGSIHWAFVRAVMTSVADTAVFPLQDILGLGSEARMNMPGTAAGNWGWRYGADALTPEITRKLRALTRLCGR